MPTAMVTGASSGIGEELARIHAERGGDLILVARRTDRLESLKEELEPAFGIKAEVITQDLAIKGAASELVSEVGARGLTVDYLINNAGFGAHGLFHEREWQVHEDMIQVNIMALSELTRLVLPGMISRKQGRILNIASHAGFLPGPLQAVYYASKAYVISFSEAIANELIGTGVTVTALCPGGTETEFALRGDLEGTRFFKMGNFSTAREVAGYGYEAMMNGQALAVHGMTGKMLVHGVLKVFPRQLVTRMSRTMMEK